MSRALSREDWQGSYYMAIQRNFPEEVRFEQKCEGEKEDVAEFCCFNIAPVGFANGLDPGCERKESSSF